MKNTARVQTQPSAPVAASQPETPGQPAAQAVADVPEGLNLPPDAHQRCLAYYDRKDKVAVSRVPLSEDENVDVMVSARRVGLSSGQYVADAIREKLSRDRGGYFDAVTELKQSVHQSTALMQLLSDQLEFRHLSGCDVDETKNASFVAGVNLLMQHTTAKLQNDYHKLLKSNAVKSAAS